ncbi:MAG: tail fiber domain-containing protein [Ferruginibacter sp.]
MKRLLLIAKFLLAAATATFAQSVGINATGAQPNASSILDVSSTTKGLLIPRMTAAQRTAIAAPATGLQVYQTDGTAGFYYYNGAAWVQLGAAANLTGWSTTGNTSINAATNFIGTTDGSPLIAKINGEQVFRFTPLSTSTVIGYQASNANPAGGSENHFIGNKAGFSNNGGFDNHFEGWEAGYANTNGYNNQFIGIKAGHSNQTGTDNLFIGSNAGYNSNVSGNHFIGNGAGYANSTGVGNHFTGYGAGGSNTSGSYNQFDGNHAGFSNTISSGNYFSGYYAGYTSTGSNNYMSGINTGKSNESGNGNTFVGNEAGMNNVYGNYNVYNGFAAGFNNTGNGNVLLGYGAGKNGVGNDNVFIGYQAGADETGSHKLIISNTNTATPLIYGDFGSNSLKVYGHQEIVGDMSGAPSLVLKGGPGYQPPALEFTSASNPSSWRLECQYLWNNELVFSYNGSEKTRMLTSGDMFVYGVVTDYSDRILKKNIQPLQNSLQKLIKLGGYTYNWIDTTRSDKEQIGLIAQEVEKQFPQLVLTDHKGIKSVAYAHLVPVVIEAMKEQQVTIVAMQQENEQLKKDIAAIKLKLGM